MISAPDPRAKGSVRLNILAVITSEPEEKLWILTHMDVVPPGDLFAWTETKLFEPMVREGRVYERESENNGQSLVALLVTTKAVLEEIVKPRRIVALVMVVMRKLARNMV